MSVIFGAFIHAGPTPADDDAPGQTQQPASSEINPKSESAKNLLRRWRGSARANGMIPGGALGSLVAATENFVKFNPTDRRTEKLARLLKRMDTTRDWTVAEAVSLLDDVTDVYDSLPNWAETNSRFSIADQIRTGHALTANLESAPWGPPQPSGLRAAWLLDPQADEYPVGTPLRSRILILNSGKQTVVFRALSWNQSGVHWARSSDGAEITVTSTDWTTIPQVFVCRLAPGQFTEVVGAGIGIGVDRNNEDWQAIRVGSWIDVRAGQEVTFAPAPISANGRHDGRVVGKPKWWLGFISDRLARDQPLPDDAAERKRLLERAVKDLFGNRPTPQETAMFVDDTSEDAMQALALRLSGRAGTLAFSGELHSGETTFTVLAADPQADKKPRVVSGPGRYTLGERTRLIVSRKRDGERLVNDARIQFFSSNPKSDPAPAPSSVALPDGLGSWAIAWQRQTTVLWVVTKQGIRRFDFADPSHVIEKPIEPASESDIPKLIQETLRGAIERDE